MYNYSKPNFDAECKLTLGFEVLPKHSSSINLIDVTSKKKQIVNFDFKSLNSVISIGETKAIQKDVKNISSELFFKMNMCSIDNFPDEDMNLLNHNFENVVIDFGGNNLFSDEYILSSISTMDSFNGNYKNNFWNVTMIN